MYGRSYVTDKAKSTPRVSFGEREEDQFMSLPMFIDEYVVQHEIGGGGMKVVVRGVHMFTGESLAIALLDPAKSNSEIKERFLQEARAMQKLKGHPHIVSIFKYGECDGWPFMLMELMEGGNLASRLRAAPMPIAETIEVARSVCSALRHSHNADILHRDLKPENILLTNQGLAKLVDFGLAKVLDSSQSLTQTRQLMGTRFYASPEQSEVDAKRVTKASDIYSFGATLLDMLLGRQEFIAVMQQNLAVDVSKGKWLLSNLSARREQAVQEGSPVVAQLFAICEKCMQYQPSDRYANVDQLSEALDIAGKLMTEPILANRYQLIALLDRGGMGEVWKAHDKKHDVEVVIKYLPELLRQNPAEVRRLRSSFQLVKSLRHPHICPIYDFDEDAQVGVFLVMKFIQGINLSQAKQRRQGAPYSLAEVRGILAPIAAALDHAHSEQVLHRDVKPANIMLPHDQRGSQLVDFGIAASIRDSLEQLTGNHQPLGTAHYMPPEAFRTGKLTAQADQCSLAIVAYEMLGGHTPFADLPAESLYNCWRNEQVLALKLPEQVNKSLLRALDANPSQRFPDCTAFITALTSCDEEHPAKPKSQKLERSVAKSFNAPFAASLGRRTVGMTTALILCGALIWAGQGWWSPKSSAMSIEKTVSLSDDLIAKGEVDKAERVLSSAIENEPSSAELFAARGRVHLASRNFDDAIRDLKRATTIDPTFASAWSELGHTHALLDDQRKAVEAFSQALKINADDLTVRQGRAVAYRKLNQYDLAIDDFNQVLEVHSRDAECLEARGWCFEQLTQPAAALADFRDAVKFDPSRSHLNAIIDRCEQLLKGQSTH